MPIHDWTRVDAGLFHDFHQSWTVELRNALNGGALPPDYFALVEQKVQGPVPDVLTLKLAPGRAEPPRDGGGCLAVTAAPPSVSLVQRNEASVYAARANRVTVRHRHGDIVAVIEVISPGNKASREEFRALVAKAREFLRHGVHLLLIDLLPVGRRDPEGIHRAIWDELEETSVRPPDKPLTLTSYDAGEKVAYVQFIGVGDELPAMPLFLRPGYYIPAPLEASYQEAWASFPAPLKGLLQGGAASD